MTPSDPPARIETAAQAAEGGPAAAVSGALEAGMLAAVQASRPGVTARLATLNLELTGEVEPGSPLQVTAWVERATRTLAFASADIHAAGRRVATGGAVFSLS